MSRYTETQTRKVISSYGGVGSIIETPKGALMIEDFDRWPFFKSIKDGIVVPEKHWVVDNRLLNRLRHIKGFPKLETFLKVPANVSHPVLKHLPSDENLTISSVYFPKWFYCNNCERLMKLDEWWKRWEGTLQKHKIKPVKESFIPPVCYHCFDEAKNSKDGKRKRLYHHLEQVRFILTAPSGEIEDIPWDRWPNAKKKTKEDNSDSGNIEFDFDNFCCDNQDLRYVKSTKFSDLAGIRIECASCGQRNTLSGLFGVRLHVFDKEKVYKKPVIRTSNSVYYPIMINSIFLPAKEDITPDDKEKIKKWIEKVKDIEFIYDALLEKYEKNKLEQFIKGEVEGMFEPESLYRLKEYKFLTDPDRERYPTIDDDSSDNLIFQRQNINELKEIGFSNLTSVSRLKITTIQTAYTRQEPLDKDQFLSGEADAQLQIDAKYTSSWGKDTKYLPAVESFGEGIFLALDLEVLDNWLNNAFINLKFSSRISQLWENFASNERVQKNKFIDQRHLARFVLVHTLSHLIIKELEFLCGYPATSLNERLFVDDNEMHGLLIYTVAGTEGSYGGLASQATERNFIKILKSALIRATDCASDPICYHSDDGQGVGGLNLAACYSCSLIPENACEEFNSFLDRAILVDENYGFFKQENIKARAKAHKLAGHTS